MYLKRKIPLLFFLIILFFLIFFSFEYSSILTFIEDILLTIISQKEKNYFQFFLLMILFNFFYFLSPLPVFPLLLLNGFVFGWPGFIFSMFFILICSLLIFSFSKFFLKDTISKISYINFIKLKTKKYNFIYNASNTTIFLSRYIVPYFFHNILFGFYNLKLKNFLFIIFLAEIPLTLATNSIGDSLNSFVLTVDYGLSQMLFDFKFIMPFIFILFIILISGALQKIIVKKSN